MKAKLITDDNNNYSLLDSNNNLIATTMESMVTNQKLSLKNCEAIENGYDIFDLSIECMKNTINQDTGGASQKLSIALGFQKGFKKALELLGDKKFSEKELTMLFAYGHQIGMNNVLAIQSQHSPQPMSKPDSDKLRDELIQSLQQTEWDVEMEMECCGNYKPCNINCEYGPKPKLDENGCLILNKKL